MNYQAKIGAVPPDPSVDQALTVPQSPFAQERGLAHPAVMSRDPAERLEFSRPPSTPPKRFDLRTSDALVEAMFDHSDAQERERAAWEYADRLQDAAVGRLSLAAERESEPTVRWGLLWLIQKVAGNRAIDAIEPFLRDDHPEVRDWARLLLREMNDCREQSEVRAAKFDLSNPFDQTLPLMIAGHARTLVPGMGWVHVTLSPKWFESILGRVMACTCTSSFATNLVIEKRVKDYHPDGTDHYEIFKFKGFTFALTDAISRHVYECVSSHTFYPSGKVEHEVGDAIDDMGVVLNRVAETEAYKPGSPGLPSRIIPVETMSIPLPHRRDDYVPERIVRSVRGRYMGAAYVNVARLMENGLRIGPGEVQLSSYHHPRAGDLTNTFISGTFKGKLSDIDGDGDIDINTEPCHGTTAGELDYALLGRPNADPFDPFRKV